MFKRMIASKISNDRFVLFKKLNKDVPIKSFYQYGTLSRVQLLVHHFIEQDGRIWRMKCLWYVIFPQDTFSLM